MNRKKEQFYTEELRKVLGGSPAVYDDDTICDCETFDAAFEVDFANKWAESVGQALHYAKKSKKKPGVYIIVRSIAEEKHVEKIAQLCRDHNIILFIRRDYESS